ncbi:hypothetical protein [Clostridium homopropionicum]|uniref:hypothetical protein n=1 Tax=Clostridium homopropionicum TaxID=36844 RepID=UPI00111445C9|nr:hypothetical protein [Clostridium homopropionicum]
MDQKVVLISGFPVRSSSLVLDFGEYIKIINDNQAAEIYHKSEVTYENSCLNSKQPRAVFDYFKKLSSYVNVMEDGKKVLFKQYEKIITVRKDSCCPHI